MLLLTFKSWFSRLNRSLENREVRLLCLHPEGFLFCMLRVEPKNFKF